MNKQRRRLRRLAAAGAVVFGLAAGSYGVASAASTPGSSAGSSLGTALSGTSSSAPSTQQPWGGQRSDETLLTGDTASKVRAAAVAKVTGATVVRVETDADGNAVYEVHMVKQDGTSVTVYVDKQFDVVSVANGMPGAPQQQPQA